MGEKEDVCMGVGVSRRRWVRTESVRRVPEVCCGFSARVRSRVDMRLHCDQRSKYSSLPAPSPPPRPPPSLAYPLACLRQARGFGRRLSWMALVPFADALNHSNVPVKYDLDMAGNGLFRLYPSPGARGYRAGEEVFNSYGRF